MTTESQDSTLLKNYDPAAVEGKWFEMWKNWGVFEADPLRNPERPVYHMPMPPPNVTGSLHMGHAMFCTLQDSLVRYHRMRGFETLYQPGTAHRTFKPRIRATRLQASVLTLPAFGRFPVIAVLG